MIKAFKALASISSFMASLTLFGWLVDQRLSMPAIQVFPILGVCMLLAILSAWLTI